ncbi:Spc98 family-domain-containing protein, partial [Melanogaster broomeanus]
YSHVMKARIQSHDGLANALETSYRRVKEQTKDLTDLDEEIKLSHLPDHLQLLVSPSCSCGSSTLAFAETYKEAEPLKSPPPITWKDILAEEPFEGEHWEGVYGLPAGATVEGRETQSNGSTASLSPWDQDDSLDEDDSRSSLEDLPPSVVETATEPEPRQPVNHLHNDRGTIEELKAQQYWRDNWRIDADVSRPFDLGDPSTLGMCKRCKYIHEEDAVREVLMSLQGQKNFMIYTTPDTFSSVPSPTAPRLLHFTLTAQSSILGAFARVTTTICHLRKFVSAISHTVSAVHERSASGTTHLLTHNIRSRTMEAFADAVDSQIQTFDRWCAEREEAICHARAGIGDHLVVSLLSLEKHVRDAFAGTFDVLLDVLRRVVTHVCQSHDRFDQAVWNLATMPTRVPPAVVSALLLDLLLEAVEEQLSMGNAATSTSLSAVYAKAAEPVWDMIGKWLKDGMPVRNALDSADDVQTLDEEFFIEDNELLVLDPDFWAEGYDLRKPVVLEEERNQSAVPTLLERAVLQILGAGKAVGLLRTMGIHSFSGHAMEKSGPLFVWRSFTELFDSNAATIRDSESLSHLISEEVSSYCLAAGMRLSRLLTEECDVSRHIAAIEGLYLMTRGDVISNFTDVLFAKMDSQQAWNDFHFLNSAFSDAIESSNSNWIENSLVRLSYRGNQATTISKTVKAIDGLLVEYAMPFPLTYIFTPSVLQGYCSIFVFLLQVRRAKSVLERILLRGAVINPGFRNELKVFYAMRGKLSWFIKVIQSQVLGFRTAFCAAGSLDEVIRIHNDHLEKLLCQCFLDSTTSSISKAVVSVLNMCMHFRDFFTRFAGDTTHDISRLSISMRRHRSRRQRRQRRDVIGFSLPQPGQESEDESDPDLEAEEELKEAPEPSFSVAPSYSEEDLSTQLETLSQELDGLVRYIRRGVESMAGRTSDVASAFGVLSFTLEDWDS